MADGPPRAEAGKNLTVLIPSSRAAMIHDASAHPGSTGTPAPRAQRTTSADRPGDTRYRAPASMAASAWAASSTVPAPTTRPSTSPMTRIASAAAGVRKVTSAVVMPPATRARPTLTPCAAESTTTTGTTGLTANSSDSFIRLS